MSKLSKSKQRQLMQRSSRYYALVSQLPFLALAGYGIGYLLDRYFGTSWLRAAILIAALIGGFVQLIQQVLSDQQADHSAPPEGDPEANGGEDANGGEELEELPGEPLPKDADSRAQHADLAEDDIGSGLSDAEQEYDEQELERQLKELQAWGQQDQGPAGRRPQPNRQDIDSKEQK